MTESDIPTGDALMNWDEAVSRVISACSNDVPKARAVWMSSPLNGSQKGEPVLTDLVTALVSDVLLGRAAVSPAHSGPLLPTGNDGRGFLTASTRAIAEPMMARYRLAAQFPDAGREPTGLKELDKEINLEPGTLNLLAGREGCGKSAALIQWGGNISCRGPVVYVLTEMTREQVITRLVSCMGHLEKWRLERGAREETLQAAERTLQWIEATMDMHIIQADGRSLDDIIRAIDWYAQKSGGLRAVVVDNLWGVVAASNAVSRAGSLSLGIGLITKKLLEFSKAEHWNCPILLAHHLNREAAPGALAKTKANGNEVGPGTENLGGSDQIGFDADLVMLLTKDPAQAVTMEDSVTMDDPWFGTSIVPSSTPNLSYNNASIIIAKNRSGEPGKILKLRFYGAQQRFETIGEPATPLTVTVDTRTARDDEFNRRKQELPGFDMADYGI